MAKTGENLNLDIKFNALVLALTLFVFMFLIFAGPILVNSQIEFIKALFPELPGVSINYPTLPEISQSLSEPIIALSSVGIFIAITLISIFVYIKLIPNKIYSFIDSKRISSLFYIYILIAGFFLFMGFDDAISTGVNTVVSLSVLVSIGIFYVDTSIANLIPHKGKSDQNPKVKLNLKWRRDKKGRPYAICPKCHSRIYYLEAEEFVAKIFRNLIVAPNENGELSCYEWFNDDNTPGQEDPLSDESNLDDFECPKCGEIIAETYEEAKALFQKKVAKNE